MSGTKLFAILFGILIGAAPLLAESVTCREDSGATFRLSFDWQAETVDIAVQNGKNWKTLYRKAVAARNNAQDKSFLAEGAAANWAGGMIACGQAVETLFFDVVESNGKREGTLERTPRWKGGSSCAPKYPAPDTAGGVTNRISCS